MWRLTFLVYIVLTLNNDVNIHIASYSCIRVQNGSFDNYATIRNLGNQGEAFVTTLPNGSFTNHPCAIINAEGEKFDAPQLINHGGLREKSEANNVIEAKKLSESAGLVCRCIKD